MPRSSPVKSARSTVLVKMLVEQYEALQAGTSTAKQIQAWHRAYMQQQQAQDTQATGDTQ